MKSKMMHTRIDKDLKQKADAIFNALGINTADAIRMFLTQVTLNQGMPFNVKLPNKETVKAMDDSKLNRNLTHIAMDDFDKFFNV